VLSVIRRHTIAATHRFEAKLRYSRGLVF